MHRAAWTKLMKLATKLAGLPNRTEAGTCPCGYFLCLGLKPFHTLSDKQLLHRQGFARHRCGRNSVVFQFCNLLLWCCLQ